MCMVVSLPPSKDTWNMISYADLKLKKGLYEMALRTAYTLIHFLSIKNSDFFILNFITIDWTIDQIFLSK